MQDDVHVCRCAHLSVWLNASLAIAAIAIWVVIWVDSLWLGWTLLRVEDEESSDQGQTWAWVVQTSRKQAKVMKFWDLVHEMAPPFVGSTP